MSDIHLRLRPHTAADLPNYVTWLNDPEVTEFTALESGNVTLEGEREWLAQISHPECRARNWAIEVAGRHIGVCSLVPDSNGSTAYFGIIIGDRSAWNKGYGTAALREVLRIGFQEMSLHRIRLDCHAGNARGIRCYEKCGFRHEGVARQARSKRGRWVDVVQMAILREEWEEINRQPEGGGIHIQSFRMADYEQVLTLWQAVGFQGWSLLTRDQVVTKLRSDPDLFLVACLQRQVVGTVMGSWDGYRGWAYNVAVHPSHQRQGIGRILMSELEKRLWSKGARILNLHYFNDSTWARDFYHSLGFQDASNATLAQKVLKEPIT